MIDAAKWAAVPFHFWSVVAFCLGCIVGSFLNVCIHRMPRGESVVSPPSSCPHCGYRIPWYLNMPIAGWCWLKGRCASCGAKISARYVAVELLTGCLVLATWLAFGRDSFALAFAYAVFLSGLMVATFIDFEHFIIPDEITLGGAALGFVFSFLIPGLHARFSGTAPLEVVPVLSDPSSPIGSLQRCFLGAGLGWLVMYGILRLGKLLFGRERIQLEPGTEVHFGELGLHLPDREIPYDELLYRASDKIRIEAERIELVDRCYPSARVELSREALSINEETIDPETVAFMELRTSELNLPREAMGLGDVKFMLAIGAFLGWAGVLFTLMASAMIGASVGILAILLRRREWSSRIPYGPYLAGAAAVWVFAGEALFEVWLGR